MLNTSMLECEVSVRVSRQVCLFRHRAAADTDPPPRPPCSSFVREFVAEPYDGVTALLDLLKMIQLSQTDYAGEITRRHAGEMTRRHGDMQVCRSYNSPV